ncbi:MAG: C39 family peptidase [Anaerolineae bacterium]
MSRKIIRLIALMVLMVFTVSTVSAQEETLPSSFTLYGFTYIAQTWNNCGPATLTMGLTYFGVEPEQQVAANWLKPNYEDKNVSPWQMVQYVNDFIPGVWAVGRVGGTLERIKTLLVNEFPVIIESGYDPVELHAGWMGHYLLVVGYDDNTQMITTYDSYDGQNYQYSYDHINEFWAHFNRQYIALYPTDREEELMTLLGTDAETQQNFVNALEMARQDAIDDPNNSFAWFNMGSSFVGLGMYAEAAVAYDQARTVGEGLPWRMFWYQFGALDAYIAVGRYNDVISITAQNLNDGGGQYVEETYYYRGLAREGLGENDNALTNYYNAIEFNPNFTPAIVARDRILAAGG